MINKVLHHTAPQPSFELKFPFLKVGLWIFVLFVFSSSCKKEEVVNSNTPLIAKTPLIAQDRSTPMAFAASAGSLHNAGLEHLRTTFNFAQSFPSTRAFTDSLLFRLCSFFQATQSLSFSTGYQTFARDSLQIAFESDMFQTNARILTYLSRVRTSSVATTYLTTVELNFIDSLSVFFSTNVSGLTKAQVCALTHSKSIALLSAFNQLNWPAGQGTLARGALETLKSTSMYWANHDPRGFIGGSGTLTGSQGWIILQADCVGYIYGWAGALIDDANSPGGVQPSGQDRRIQQGFLSASGWSAGAAMGL
jgi:hypothetical protein